MNSQHKKHVVHAVGEEIIDDGGRELNRWHSETRDHPTSDSGTVDLALCRNNTAHWTAPPFIVSEISS